MGISTIFALTRKTFGKNVRQKLTRRSHVESRGGAGADFPNDYILEDVYEKNNLLSVNSGQIKEGLAE